MESKLCQTLGTTYSSEIILVPALHYTPENNSFSFSFPNKILSDIEKYIILKI